MGPFSKNVDFNLRRDHQKNSYRDYESVDEKSLPILGYVPKTDEKNNSGSKG